MISFVLGKIIGNLLFTALLIWLGSKYGFAIPFIIIAILQTAALLIFIL